MEVQELIARCAALLAGVDCANLPVRVVVADDWTRLFMAEPPRNARRMQDLQAAAAMRFLALYGEAPAEWELRGDWRVGASFPVCAMPRALLAALDQIAGDHKLRLVSLQPYFISAWNRYARLLPTGAWFGAVQGDSLMLGVVADGSQRRLQAVRRIAIPADGHGLPWLQEQLARTALQLSLPAPPQLCLSGNRERFWIASAALGTPVVLNLDQARTDDAIASSPAIVLADTGLPS